VKYEVFVNEPKGSGDSWKLVKGTNNGTHALITVDGLKEKGYQVKLLKRGKPVKI
jgi:hypothetical protein